MTKRPPKCQQQSLDDLFRASSVGGEDVEEAKNCVAHELVDTVLTRLHARRGIFGRTGHIAPVFDENRIRQCREAGSLVFHCRSGELPQDESEPEAPARNSCVVQLRSGN